MLLSHPTEGLPTGVLEAMACGTPAAGVADVVRLDQCSNLPVDGLPQVAEPLHYIRQQTILGVRRDRVRGFGTILRQIVLPVKPRLILLIDAYRKRFDLLPCILVLGCPIGGATVDDQPLEIIEGQRQQMPI